MKASWKRSTAAFVLAALGAGGTPALAQQAAPAAEAEADRGIADIIVTATRREENLNKIPVAIQALTGESLAELNVTNFDKLLEFLPNVQAASQGPGTSAIYIRGLSTDTPGLQIVGTAGAAPNVALYLNDAPAATPGRNLDVYAADLQRVEVLAGPQGTLFGASSMGGAVRYITNKPDLKEFHAGFTGSYAMTKGGKNSVAGQAFINIPVVDDKFGIRLVVYNDQQGGYIDNVAGTYQMPFNGHVGEAGKLPEGNPLLVRRALESCTGVVNCTGSTYKAPIRQKINNDQFVENNFNDASYIGGRIAATFKLSDDWSIDLMHMRQRLKTDGVFNYEPGVGDLKVTQFNPNSLRDNVNLSTLTINGRLGALDLIYSGSYLNRNSVQKADYASYSNIGLFLPYYECDRGIYYTAAYNGNIGNTCYTPSKSYRVRNKNQRITHELRISTPTTGRFRANAGVFYDINKLKDNTDWSYLQQAAGFIYRRSANPAVNPFDTAVKPIAVGFFNDVQRRDRQLAIFGEAAFDIVPEKLTLTLGARYYNEQASQNGSSNTSFGFGSRGIYNPVTGTYSAAAVPPQFYGISANLNTVLKDVSPAKYHGLLKKANLTYKIGERSLIYATYSEGYRPGGFNRKPCNIGSATCPTAADFAKLAVYVPDEVTNYEIGGKFSLLDRTLQINVAAYKIDWSNIQITLFDQNISNQTFTTNLVDAKIKGIEGDVTWRATPELTFNIAGSYNDSSLTKYRKNTVVLLPLGSSLSNSPKFQSNIRMRYETELASGLKPYFQASFHHVGSSISSIIDNVSIRYPTFNATAGYAPSVPVTYNGVTVRPGDVVTPLRGAQPQSSYNTFSAAIGINKDNWGIELFAENLTDERPELYKSGNDGELRITTSRPRTIGLRASFKM
jgi:outer membrane receptor protein involved in Fe transport